MNTFKTLILASTVALATFSTLAQARGPDPERQLEHLNSVLQLSTEQAAKVEVVLKDTRAQRERLLEEQRPQREAMRQQMMGLHENTRAQLVDVLSPEQLAKFDEMHERHMSRMKERRDGGMGSPMGGGRGMKDCGAFMDDEE